MSVFDNFELCQDILESLPIGICVLDTQKRIVFWSHGAERITGRLRHEVIGRSCISDALLHCDHPGCEFCSEDCPIARSMKTARPSESLCFVHHRAGHQRLVRTRAVPVHNAHGSVVGAAAVFDEQDEITHEAQEERRAPAACIDPSTGIAGPELMRSQLRSALSLFREKNISFALLGFHFQYLAQFRANFGTEAAASLLRVFARTLEGALWRTDVVGRWSDEEFLVILCGCTEEALYSLHLRLHRLLAEDAIGWWGERRSLPFTITYTVCHSGDTIESILARARVSKPTDARIDDLAAISTTAEVDSGKGSS